MIKLITSRKEWAKITPSFSRYQKIGIDFEGVNLSKEGRICLMQIATPDKEIFLVDPLAAGMEIISQDSKPFLESKNLVKIIHDCRKDTEALSTISVKMENVFDTQVAHSFYLLQKQHQLQPPKKISR
eukprot:TRINITY_DN8056_c0_g1_i1.p1 TRINITY_DN8056_c0_g1~~TRINITY_DN8056_c0_g1_i1.p1  ORF type:complete len:128 (+),score=23.76 TRINITY_DN8056_c0_g1_i1:76-459(+)